MIKMIKMKNKKAEMTSQQIIGLVVLVVIIGVLLLFLSGIIPWGRTAVDKDTCHTSIVLRSTYNSAVFETSKIIPLKCATEKICLSGGGECEDIVENSKVKLNSDVEKAKQQILDTIANAMYDCNSILGEGKLDFMPHSTWSENYCLICSRLVFDEKTKQEAGSIGYGELYRYLEEKKTPDGKSYLEYLYPGWKNADDAKILFENMKKESENNEFKKMNFDDWKIYANYEGGYAIIAQMRPKGTWDKWVKIGGVVTGGIIAVIGIASIPVSGPIGAAIAAAGTKIAVSSTLIAGGAIYIYDHPSNKYKWVPPSITPYDKETLKSLQCSSFETAP